RAGGAGGPAVAGTGGPAGAAPAGRTARRYHRGRTGRDKTRSPHVHVGLRMQGAMFMAPEPWPIVTAVAERELSSFGPPSPDTTPEPDTFMARLGELPLLAQPGERWLYSAGSQVLGVLAARAAGVPFEEVMRERVLAP